MMEPMQTTTTEPTANYMDKVRKSIDSNHPAEIAYREGEKKRKEKQAAEVEYDRREYVDGEGVLYVIEDREDGPYVMAKQKGDEEVQAYEQGLKLDMLPDDAVEKDISDRVEEIAAGTLEVGEGAMRGVGLGLTKFVTSVVRTAVDNPIGDMAIGAENVEAFEKFSNEFLANAEEVAKKSGITGEEFGSGGKIAVGVGDIAGQYVAPAGALYKGFRAVGAAPLLAGLLADGSVGFAGVAPESENIFNMIPEDSEAFGLLNEVMGTDPEDPEFENRLRNTGEAMLMLGIGEAVVKGTISSLRAGKNAVKSMDLPEKVNKLIDKNVDKAIKGAAGAGGAAAIAPTDANAAIGDEGQSIDSYLETLRQVESGGDPLAKNPNSSAKGLYQFIDSTGKEFGLDKVEFGTEAYTQAEERAVRELTSRNEAGLEKALGRSPTQGELYLAHQQGLGGALKILQNPTKNAVELLGREQVKLNGGHEGMNAIQFARLWTKKFDGSKAGAEGVEVAGIGKQGFELLADMMKKGPSNEVVAKAGNLLAEDGGRIVPDETALRVREAIESGGSAQGIDFNLSRMETPEQLDLMIDEISEIYKEPIKKSKGGVQTFDDTQAKADLSRMTGFNVEEVLGRREGELWPAHKIKAARDIFVSELEKTEDLARAIKEGENTSENMIAFRRQLAVVSAVQSQIKGVQTETARALGQYRMTAKTPMETQVNIAEMMEKTGGADANQQLVDAYLNVLENGGADAGATFARNANQVTGTDMLYEAWINSLLGSPTTHAVNMVGNSLTIAQSGIERFVAATYGAAERSVGNTFGKEIGGITFKEAAAHAQGQAMATKDAISAMFKAFKTGEGSDLFGKIDYYQDAITTQNVNELPLSKTIASKMMNKDEMIESNSQLAHMIDFMGEYYYRLPGRFLMAEDELFKTMNYRGQIHALAAREAGELGLDKVAAKERLNEILADPQLNAPEIHRNAFEFSREQTFTTPPPQGGPAQNLQRTLTSAKIGNFPAGRVVVPFFNVINNITKYTASRTPLPLLNSNSKTFKDIFSGDAAARQMAMGKIATGSSFLGLGAYLATNGICTGRISDNPKMVSQIEKGQGKKRYSCQLPGSDRTFSYNRLEPAGMLMAISADTANALAYVDNEEERQSVVLAATAAIVPYMQDKSFFEGISSFFEAFNPQFGGDESRSGAMGRFFSDIAASAPGAIGGPLAPGTPLSRNLNKNLLKDNARRMAEANKWSIEKDKYGEDILVPNSEDYQNWERTINKIMSATPGLASNLPIDVNVWGEEIRYEGGLGPDIITPIYANTPAYDIKDLKGKNFPKKIEAGQFRDVRVGAEMTIEQHRKFVDVVGIDGELERLNMPLNKPRSDLSARVNGKVVGLPVELNPSDRIDLIRIMNEIRVPNDAHPERKHMNLKETLNWMITQPEYAMLPDDRDATGAKGDLIRKVYNEYKGSSIELFFAQHPKGQAYFKRSVQMKQKAQNTGVQ